MVPVEVGAAGWPGDGHMMDGKDDRKAPVVVGAAGWLNDGRRMLKNAISSRQAYRRLA